MKKSNQKGLKSSITTLNYTYIYIIYIKIENYSFILYIYLVKNF